MNRYWGKKMYPIILHFSGCSFKKILFMPCSSQHIRLTLLKKEEAINLFSKSPHLPLA